MLNENWQQQICLTFSLLLYNNVRHMTASISAQDQIANFLAEAIPEKILAFKFDASIQKRIEELVYRKKEGTVTPAENEELERYLAYDLLIGLAKARASMYVENS